MSRPPTVRLGIDLDGVLCDFNERYAQRLGIELPPEGPPVWDYPKHLGVSAAVYTKAWDELTDDVMFWRGLSPYASAREALKWMNWLRNHGHHIYFITSRPRGLYMKRAAEEWLLEQGFRNPTVLMSDTKGPLANGLGLTHFVDDKPENCVEVYDECGGTCQVALVDQPYNRHFNPNGSIVRIYNLVEYISTAEAELATRGQR